MEGLWHAQFIAGAERGEGMAVLHDGQILGGDPTHTYTGTYQLDGERVYASVCITRYGAAVTPAVPNRPLTVFLRGTVTGESGVVSGHPDNKADLKIDVELHRAA